MVHPASLMSPAALTGPPRVPRSIIIPAGLRRNAWRAPLVGTAGRIDTWSDVREVRNGVVTYVNHYVFAATGEALVSEGRLRFRSQAELTQSLADAGFAVERTFGDWDRRPAGPTTRELIVVARRD